MSEIIAYPLPLGPNYTIPDVGDINWGQAVTNFLVAIPAGTLPTQGTFTLTGDLSFGASYGVISTYFKSLTANVATAGVLRLAKTDAIEWRNNANSANNVLAVDSLNELTFNGVAIGSSTSVLSITGTVNQVIASSPTGAVTLSLPQDIATTSSPTFAGLTLTGEEVLRMDIPILFFDTVHTNYVAMAATSSIPNNYTLLLPPNIGSANGVLVTDGVNQTAWTNTPTFAGTTMTGNIAMGSHGITGLANGVNPQDAATVVQTTFVAPTIQKFTSGSGTYTLPTSPRSPLYIRVRMIGSGGGGASGGPSGGPGSAGSVSTFGSSLLTANGGGGGGVSSPGAGGTVSIASGPLGFGTTGDPGTLGANSINGLVGGAGGNGGAGPFGGAGLSGGGSGATNSGSGGSGGYSNDGLNDLGGCGGGSGGYIDVIINSPASTYSYSVGVGGAGQAIGFTTGGNGAAGLILIEEFYQ